MDAGGGRRARALHARLRSPPSSSFRTNAPWRRAVRRPGRGVDSGCRRTHPSPPNAPTGDRWSVAETKDLIAGWMVIDVESWDRAVQPLAPAGKEWGNGSPETREVLVSPGSLRLEATRLLEEQHAVVRECCGMFLEVSGRSSCGQLLDRARRLQRRISREECLSAGRGHAWIDGENAEMRPNSGGRLGH